MNAPQRPDRYDNFPYESRAFRQTHPDRLATVAHLFGMMPAAPEKCRVLEVGCAAGGNLLPMASQYPGSEFVGIDFSTRQIADGQRMVTELAVPNLRLIPMDILDVDAGLGKFDYIIAHGVYSWVPPAVQDKLLGICRRLLTPNGVAYVSYNTYPGWHMRGIVRDAMCYHTQSLRDEREKVAQARAVLAFLAQAAQASSGAYCALLKEEAAWIATQSDFYLAHEQLEEVNQPVYFYQFIERLVGHQLQYLGDAQVGTMLASSLPLPVAETLTRIATDIHRMEQYLDFVRNRTFRQTLITHSEVPLTRQLAADKLYSFVVDAQLKSASPAPDIRTRKPETYRAVSGSELTVVEPLVKAAFQVLEEAAPQTLGFERLCHLARASLKAGKSADWSTVKQDHDLLGRELLAAYLVGAVDFRMNPTAAACQPGRCPKTTPLVRYQARHGLTATNLRHESIQFNELDMGLLQMLDGSRDRETLKVALERQVIEGKLTLSKNGVPVTEGKDIKKAIAEYVDLALLAFVRHALLV